MRPLRDLPIRHKLTLIAMLTSIGALLLACGAFTSYDLLTFRKKLGRDLSILAEVIGANSTAALTFGDAAAATEALGALKVQKHVVSACVYDRAGRPFATYLRGAPRRGDWPLHGPSDEILVGQSFVSVSRRVWLDQEQVGTVYIRSDLEEIRSRFLSYALIAALVLLAASLVALILSSRLQGVVAKPVMNLVAAAREVTERRNYAARATKHGDDELGTLIDAFNGMLGQIEQRDDQLRRHRDDLEQEVAARTAELRAANQDLVEARDRAESGSRAKSEFLANMSHEIRTPLNGVVGMIELTLESPLTREQRDYLETAQKSAETLLGVINDVLDFSKIEAGRLALDPIEFQLRASLDTTLKTLALEAYQQGVELLCDVRPEVPDALIGDPGRLRQVLVNLVGNAIKFTPEGEVVLRVELEPEPDDQVVLHFLVSDTGIGIPKEKLESVFEAFTQADNSTTRHYGGTGLGLTITKRLVGLMAGEVWAESELGRGTTFHFTARFGARPRAAEVPRVVPADVRGQRILVVDDSATNRRILGETLAAWGAVPTLAESAGTALRILEGASERKERFALVIADNHMPGMDGFALAEKIREMPDVAGSTVMMLTSAGQSGDAARCRALGMAAYLTKPVSQKILFEVVSRALSSPTAARLRGDAGPADDVSPRPLITQHSIHEEPAMLRILLAEDNPVNQKLALLMLEKRGHRVVVVNDGQEAVEAVQREAYDVVLMDVHMPRMSGLDASMTIRAWEKDGYGHVPIVALTALAMSGDRAKCLQAGMDAYVTKPIRATELFEVIEQLSSNPAARRPKPDLKVLHGVGPDSPVDQNLFLETLDRDLSAVRTMIEIFRGNLDEQLGEIAKAVADCDAQALRDAAHKFKGSLFSVAAKPAAAAALRLETMGRTGDMRNLEEALAELERELERLSPELDHLLRRAA
ncbi:MAG TPA: response regulator [Candidatus Eisenbacteria bacterium]|jgi:signal transduction histidine kinase/CheY-like chemotaxis protein